MLEVKGLTKKYGEVSAVTEVSFALPPGAVGVLLGTEGAGKSTVIKSIAGQAGFQGKIRICGMASDELEAKKCFAYVSQYPCLYDALSVREALEFAEMAYGMQVTKEEKLTLLERFGLADMQEKMGNELNQDLVRRVSICCALMVKPKLLLLDEPASELDEKAIRELQEIIADYRRNGGTVLIGLKTPEIVERFWDTAFVMKQGRIVTTVQRKTAGGRSLAELMQDAVG